MCCVSSFLVLHRQEVLMNVWPEFKNPRFRVCLCHWPWASNYISSDIHSPTCKVGIIIIIFTMKCLRPANADSIWQWCVVLMTWSLKKIPTHLIKGSVWVTLQPAERKHSSSWTLRRETFHRPTYQMMADAGGQLARCARDREIRQIWGHDKI